VRYASAFVPWPLKRNLTAVTGLMPGRLVLAKFHLGDDGTAASLGVRGPKRYFRVFCLTRGGRVAWIVRLVQIGADGNEPFADVMTIDRPDDLDDIANLGLTVADGMRVLAGLQQEIVAAQARSHSVQRPECRSCSGVCHLKDCHVRFQGFRTQSPTGLFSFRLPPLMQACAVEGGH
jgi:hypothetical protein